MLAVLRAVALDIKGAVTRCVLAELVAPEVAVRLGLGYPILVHVGEQVILAEGLEEGTDAGALVRRDRCAIRLAGGGVGGW